MGISLRQFEELKNRVASPRRSPAPLLDAGLRKPATTHSLILGVDPSLRGTGYGVVQFLRPNPLALAHGTIACPADWPHSRCLVHIARTLAEVIRRHRPTVCVIEALFYAQNMQTVLTLGEARGAAMATIAGAGLEIFEIAPRKVKQAIVGYGAAQKIAVAKMVQRLLRLAELPAADAADALALALAHAQENSRYSLTAPKSI